MNKPFTRFAAVFIVSALLVSLVNCGGKGPLPAPDTTPPKVTLISPANGSKDISITTDVNISFSEDVEPSSINTQSITLWNGDKAIAGTVSYVKPTAVFHPSSELDPNTLYSIRISTAVRDLAGLAMTDEYVSLFVTGSKPDTTPPQITATSPASNASNVAANAVIGVIFTEPMNPSTIAITVVSDAGTPVSGALSYSGTTALFTPSQNLDYVTTYNATVTKAAEDLSKNPLGVDYIWRFTTGDKPDTTPPAVIGIDPSNLAKNVPVNASISITFSEDMRVSSITNSTIILSSASTGSQLQGTVFYSSRTANFVLKAGTSLDYDTVYIVSVASTVMDLAGNQMGAVYTSRFTTGKKPDTTAPAVYETTPAAGLTNVDVNSGFIITFTEAMDPLTMTNAIITLNTGTVFVQGTVTYTGVTAIFSLPTDSQNKRIRLKENTLYTARVGSAARDLAGNPLSGNQLDGSYTWQFTTGTAPDETPPHVSSVTPSIAATGVDIATAITVTFSESVDPTTVAFVLTEATGTVPVPVTMNFINPRAIYSPLGRLAFNTLYKAKVSAGVQDLSNNAMVTDFIWNFLTTKATTTVSIVAPAITYGSDGIIVITVTGDSLIPEGTIALSIDGGSSLFQALDSSGTATFTMTKPNAGAHSLSATYSAQGQFKGSSATSILQVNKATLTITADAKSKSYGSADPTFTYSVSGLVNGDTTGIISGTLNRVAGENVGTYVIAQNNLNAGNNYVITYTGADLTITPVSLLVAAHAKTKTYGATDPAFTYSTSGYVNGDTSAIMTGSLSRSTGEIVGNYPINLGTLSAGNNYVISFTGADLLITPATLAVIADPHGKAYGDVDPPLTYTATGFKFRDTVSLLSGGSLTRVPGEMVGTYAISQGTLDAGSNYAISFTGALFSITARQLTITADTLAKIYGDADPVLTYTVNGLINGDTAGSVLSGLLARTSGENAGSYTITQGTLSSNLNYVILFTNGTLTIDPRALTIVNMTASDKTYDGTVSAVLSGGSLSGVVGNDSVVIGTRTGHFSEKAVGAGKAVIVTAVTLAGAKAGNYYLGQLPAGITAAITLRDLHVTATAQNKVYDGTIDATVTLGDDRILGDVLTASSTTAVFDVKDVSASMVTVSGISIAGGDAANYRLAATTAVTSANITARYLTITAHAQTKIYGDVDPAYTYSVTGDGLVAGDALVGSLDRAAGNTVGTYAIGKGTLTAGINYTIIFTSNDLVISSRPITITADAQAKIYGDSDPPLTYSVTLGSLATGDTFTGTVSRAAGENVGTYAISQGTLDVNANYTMIFISGTGLAITRRPITVSANAQSKILNNPDPLFTWQITGGSLIGGDTISGTLSCVHPESVGTYPILQNDLTAGPNYDLTYVGADLTINP